MAEFIGSAVPNGVASFINVGHSPALGSIGDVTGFGQDQQFTAVQMLFRSYRRQAHHEAGAERQLRVRVLDGRDDRRRIGARPRHVAARRS
ncbi:hypothetical protein ZWY2020_011301 [Hordeum vulgare]|nr:hypothetical protein ZWY2020_011301 [Hordeum vulgare]